MREHPGAAKAIDAAAVGFAGWLALKVGGAALGKLGAAGLSKTAGVMADFVAGPAGALAAELNLILGLRDDAHDASDKLKAAGKGFWAPNPFTGLPERIGAAADASPNTGTAANPMHVIVANGTLPVHVTNPAAITSAVTAAQAKQASAMPTGQTAPNTALAMPYPGMALHGRVNP